MRIQLIFIFLLATVIFAQQRPYKGTPLQIPGKIEAEDFDKGGEGIAYHDEDESNNGGKYRPAEAVDIETATDGAYNIGWIQPGEWTEYTVDVKQSGLYNIVIRTATRSNEGQFHLELDGENITGTLSTPVTGGWQEWASVQANNVYLTAGDGKILRWFSESSGYNVTYFDFILVVSSDPPQVSITSPEDKADFFLGDEITITAEASDPDGTVTRVEFWANDLKIGEDTTSPYSLTWKPEEIDKYDLVAVAYDDKGVSGRSKKVDITVHFPELADGPDFSAGRGFYESPFDLTISTDIAGAKIKYTVDGSNPLNSSTARTSVSPVTVRVDPRSTVKRGRTPAFIVRAVAVNGSTQLTRIQTHTFVFIEQVKVQSRPSGWPASGVNGQELKYSVNRDIVNSPEYKDLIDDALLDIPSLSLSTDMENLFDSQSGIYVNATEHGIDWERVTSVELINPSGDKGFQIDAGLRIRGGWSRNDHNPKHAFRLFFREKYGESKLNFPLFGDEGVDEFDKIDLRCSQNYSWSYNHSKLNTANRDVYSRDLQREMGQPYTRSRYYHLYLNGLYWGLYETQERSEASYASAYFGGSRDDYDVVKVDAGYGRPYVLEATDGFLDAWKEVWNLTQTGFQDNENYFKLQGLDEQGNLDPNGKKLVDVENLIDYMITIFHLGNFDAPVSKFSGNKNPNNFYAIYNRESNDGFKFFAHDCEHTLLFDPIGPGDGIDENRVNIGNISGDRKMEVNQFEKFHPQWLHFKLTENAEYRQLFADHVYKHYFNNGILVPENATDLFMQRANMIDMAIIAESARWGDLELSKNNAWLPTINQIKDDYFYERWNIVLDQYIDEQLYPRIDPPVFENNGTELISQIEQVHSGYKVQLRNPNGTTGTIYYTLDGRDPRKIGGAVASYAQNGGDNKEVTISKTAVLSARVKSGATWSARHTLSLYIPENTNSIKITEIHYKPLPEGETMGKEFEFLELKNCGTAPVDLGLASFIKGVSFTFDPSSILPSGSFLVLASNAEKFQQRYGFEPFGEYIGQLDNSGEKLVLVTAVGDTVISVRFNDKAPWPEEPDSLGKSLVAKDVDPTGDPNNPDYWRASYWVNGSPGRDDKVATATLDHVAQPGTFRLLQNYPNPFNSETVISFEIPNSGAVTLKIYDLRGREVQTLIAEKLQAGLHKQTWDARGIATGIYFYELLFDKKMRIVKKLVYVK